MYAVAKVSFRYPPCMSIARWPAGSGEISQGGVGPRFLLEPKEACQVPHLTLLDLRMSGLKLTSLVKKDSRTYIPNLINRTDEVSYKKTKM